MSEKQTAVAPLWCDLTDELNGRIFYQLCIGAKRDVLMLSTDEALNVTGGRSRDKMQFRVHHWHNGAQRDFEFLCDTARVYRLSLLEIGF